MVLFLVTVIHHLSLAIFVDIAFIQTSYKWKLTVMSWILCSVDIRNRFIIWCPFIPSFTCQFHNNNKNLVEKVWSNCLFLLEILVINFVLLLVNYYWHHLGTSFNHRKYYHVLRVFVTRIYSISGIRQNLHCANSTK